MKKFFIIASLFAACLSTYAADRAAKLSPRLQVQAVSDVKEETVSAYVTVDPDNLDRDALSRSGVALSRDYGNVLTVRGSVDAIASLRSVEGVVYVEISSPVSQTLDISRDAVGMANLHSGTGYRQAYTGKGVVVGIVDAGFDYGHAAFRDEKGNLRIKRVWEQSAKPYADNVAPADFGYGVELTSSDVILGAGGDIRNNSHGTHVTSIAAGSDTYLDGALRGMAPDADIVLVSFSQEGNRNVNITDAIAYIFDYADRTGKPCVVNLSLGAHNGPHDGTSTFDVVADRMVGPGRLIVGSSGNFRKDVFHLRRRFESADEAPLRTFLEYKSSISSTDAEDALDVWAEEGMDFEFSVCCYKVDNGSEVSRATIDMSADGVQSVSLGRNISGNINVAYEISPLNGKRHLLVSPDVRSIRNGYAIAVEVKPLSAGYVDLWANASYFTLASKGVAGFSEPTDEATVSEIGGTAKRILTVGAYTTRSHYTKFGESTELSLPGEVDGALGTFSSGGPTADGRVKPNVCAPGCFISAAVSSNDNSGTIILSGYHTDDTRAYSYGYMQGTSMSSPHVAGIVATWLQAYPNLTPEQLLEIVAETSVKDSFTGQLAEPSNDWGYGKIDAEAGLRKCIELAKADGIEEVEADTASSSDMRVFNLQGVCVRADGSLDDLPSGLYIFRGNKILVK